MSFMGAAFLAQVLDSGARKRFWSIGSGAGQEYDEDDGPDEIKGIGGMKPAGNPDKLAEIV